MFNYIPVLLSGDNGEETSEMVLGVLEECFANEEKSFQLKWDLNSG